MKTEIFEDYGAFLDREDKTINGVTRAFLDENPNALEERENIACWNCFDCFGCSGCSDCSRCFGCFGCFGCSDCSRCSDCTDCSDCSRCFDCSDCSRCSDCFGCSRCFDCSDLEYEQDKKEKREAGIGTVPVIENIHQKVFAAANKENALEMSTWHTEEKIEDGAHCGTTHCRAGWVVALAGKDGRDLECRTNTAFAAIQIYHASSPDILVSPPRFYESNEKAMADMERCANLEAEKAK